VKARVVDVKPEAKIEPKFTMTISEFQAKQAELDGLRAHIKKLQDECASDGIS
jgi:translation initiation factor 1 (eIF-1/SUI1)